MEKSVKIVKEIETKPGQQVRIKAQPLEQYRIAKRLGAEEALDDVIAKKVGDDLELIYGDGTQVIIEDFFIVSSMKQGCSVILPGENEAGYELTADVVGGEIGEGVSVVYAYGDSDVLMSMADGNSPMQDLFTQNFIETGEFVAYIPSEAFVGFPQLAVPIVGAILAGGAVAAGSSTAATVAAAEVTISGMVVLGPVQAGHGLTINVYDDSGELLSEGTKIDDDGSYSVTIGSDYSGAILVRVMDKNAGFDYLDEGKGVDTDLTVDIRAVTIVTGAGTYVVNITPITELAVRELLSDTGGDNGTAETNLAGKTDTDISAANTETAQALGISSVSIIETTPVSVIDTEFESASSNEQMYGHALAAISGVEQVPGYTDTDSVLDAIQDGMTGSVLDQNIAEDLEAGALVSDKVSGNAGGSATFMSNAVGSSIGSIAFSADTGASNDDFITQTESQTITATLDSALSGTKLWGSVDDGVTWIDITSNVIGTDVSWDSVTISGDSFIKIAVTKDTVITFTGTEEVIDNIATQSYSLDNTNPVVTTTTFTADENGTIVGTLVGTDANDIASLAISGTDAGSFNIDASTGVLAFKSAKDFETPDDDGANGTYDITVTATDKAGNTTDQAVTVVLQNVNEVPELAGEINDQTGVKDQNFNLDISSNFSDPDAGDTLSYALSNNPSWMSINTSGVISGTPLAEVATASVVTVTATDSAGLYVNDTFNIPVVSAPVINEINSSSTLVKGGEDIVFTLTLSEAVTITGGPPTIDVTINGQSLNDIEYVSGSETKILTFTAVAAPLTGDGNNITLNTFNSAGATITGDDTSQPMVTTAGQTMTSLTVDNTDPVVTTTTFTADENGTIVGTLVGTDDNDIASWSISGTDADIFNIDDSTGVLTFNLAKDFETPDDDGIDGTYDITVTATDNVGHTADKAITVVLNNVNEAPELAGEINDQTGVKDQNFNLDISSNFNDPDTGDSLTYSLDSGAPSWMSINSSGVISGTPLAEAATASVVTVTATDSAGLYVNDTFDIPVVAAPVATSSIDGVTDLDVRSPIVLTFSENVTANTGFNIVIKETTNGGGTYKIDETTQTFTIDAADSKITISNNIVTINPHVEYDLDFGASYEVTVDAGAFTGTTSSQASVAVLSEELTFGTVTPTNDGTNSQTMTTGTDALTNSLKFVDANQSDPNSDVIHIDVTNEAVAAVLSFSNELGDYHRAYNGNISLTGVSDDDLLYLDDNGVNTYLESDIHIGGGWISSESKKTFDGTDLGADVYFPGQINIYGDPFLTDSLGVDIIVFG